MTGGIISDLVRVGIGTRDGFHDGFDGWTAVLTGMQGRWVGEPLS